MTDSDHFGVPQLFWAEPSSRGPMKALEVSRATTAALRLELGHDPTRQEEYTAYEKAIGGTALEIVQEQQREAVEAAKRLIEELNQFVEQYGGHND